jgi:hypothetical protein
LGKAICVRLRNIEVWMEFKDFVVKKHGKLHSALADEVANAFESYLEAQGTRTQNPPGPLSRKATRESEALKKEVLGKVLPGGSLPQRMLENIVRSCAGVSDRRAVKAKIETLVAVGFLERDWKADLHGKVFKVIGDEASKIG